MSSPRSQKSIDSLISDLIEIENLFSVSLIIDALRAFKKSIDTEKSELELDIEERWIMVDQLTKLVTSLKEAEAKGDFQLIKSLNIQLERMEIFSREQPRAFNSQLLGQIQDVILLASGDTKEIKVEKIGKSTDKKTDKKLEDKATFIDSTVRKAMAIIGTFNVERNVQNPKNTEIIKILLEKYYDLNQLQGIQIINAIIQKIGIYDGSGVTLNVINSTMVKEIWELVKTLPDAGIGTEKMQEEMILEIALVAADNELFTEITEFYEERQVFEANKEEIAQKALEKIIDGCDKYQRHLFEQLQDLGRRPNDDPEKKSIHEKMELIQEMKNAAKGSGEEKPSSNQAKLKKCEETLKSDEFKRITQRRGSFDTIKSFFSAILDKFKVDVGKIKGRESYEELKKNIDEAKKEVEEARTKLRR